MNIVHKNCNKNENVFYDNLFMEPIRANRIDLFQLDLIRLSR